eukprot:COSAG02_NODE_3950_length_5995_cov_2.769674_1_plen_50_part_00
MHGHCDSSWLENECRRRRQAYPDRVGSGAKLPRVCAHVNYRAAALLNTG